MTAMLLSSKGPIAAFVSLLSLASPAQSPSTDAPKNTPAPPVRVAFERLVPDAKLDLGGTRGLAAGDGIIWVSVKETKTLVRIDPKTNAITKTITLTAPPCPGMTFAFDAMWVPLCGTAGIARVDPKTNAVTATISKGLQAVTGPLTTGAGSLWSISDGKGTLARIDPVAGAVVAEVYTGGGSESVAVGQDTLWVGNAATNMVARISAYTNLLDEWITVGKGPIGVAVGEGAVWTLNSKDASVSRVDTKTNKLAETMKLGVPFVAGQITVGEGSVWVSAAGLPLARIDPRTNRVAQIFTGVGGGMVVVAEGAVWIAADAKTLWRVDPKRIEATR